MPILYTLPTGCASTASGATRSALVAKINCRRRTRMILPSRTVYAPRPCLRHYIDLYLVRVERQALLQHLHLVEGVLVAPHRVFGAVLQRVVRGVALEWAMRVVAGAHEAI